MVSVAQVVDFFTSVLKGAWLGMDELKKQPEWSVFEEILGYEWLIGLSL